MVCFNQLTSLGFPGEVNSIYERKGEMKCPI
nr:MAG TPA: hypothetical protein [Caudoviricetes sp.]